MTDMRRVFEGRMLFAAFVVVLIVAGWVLLRGTSDGHLALMLPLLIASTVACAVSLWKPHWVVRGADKSMFTSKQQEMNKIFLGLSAAATAVVLALWIQRQ